MTKRCLLPARVAEAGRKLLEIKRYPPDFSQFTPVSARGVLRRERSHHGFS
jgi:hypothetical protein